MPQHDFSSRHLVRLLTVSKHYLCHWKVFGMNLLKINMKYLSFVASNWFPWSFSIHLQLRILNLLYNLFPGLPAPHPSRPKGIEDVISYFSEALATSLPLPPSPKTRRLISSVTGDCIPPIPCLDGDFVVEEGFRVFGRQVLVAGGTELFDAYSALLLTALIDVGLIEVISYAYLCIN